ncbi:MAG TPA: deaminase [Candidatus Paceibacterota bacterium]|nr:deaminase [Candidatus Paceibacterota bacterium]
MGPISYPYLPEGRSFLYVEEGNPFMAAARNYALAHSMDDAVKTGSVVVVDGVVVGEGANGSDFHKKQECERVKRNVPTGEGYELCEGCHPKNHSEVRAIRAALSKLDSVDGADLYLWGHWWACEPCWSAILDAGIARVYLMEGSERLFNKSHPDNILGTYA